MKTDEHAVLAPAKINLFLHVTARQNDGYHALQSAFVLIDWADELVISRREDGAIVRGGVRGGAPSTIPEDDDLAIRAARALQKASGCRLGAHIKINKILPMGAGLGGGSADAATVLLALNRLWGINFSRQQLSDIGLSLGADVPFFIFGESAWAEGRGEALTPLGINPDDLSALTVAVFVPPIAIPTARIFNDPHLNRHHPRMTQARYIEDWHHVRGQGGWREDRHNDWHNDLQTVAERHHPELSAINTRWQAAWRHHVGPCDAPIPTMRMTGSGSGYFSLLFPEQCHALHRADLGIDQLIKIAYNSPPFSDGVGWSGKILHRHPLFDWAGV